jgi:hypothetical protein
MFAENRNETYSQRDKEKYHSIKRMMILGSNTLKSSLMNKTKVTLYTDNIQITS